MHDRHLWLWGRGALVAQVTQFEQREVYAFTRPGDIDAQAFARSLGCVWAGSSDQLPPVPLEAAIVFAPVGMLVPAALRSVRKGGTVVLGGIHMSDIPAMPYQLLWGERVVRSVANLTRQDAKEFFVLAGQAEIKTHVEPFALSDANTALARLRDGRLTGAAVLIPEAS
jgi:propanol-preferring alcohol dehydrogenase